MQQLESLLAENKYDEATTLIKSWVAQKLSDKERAALLVRFAALRLGLKASADEQYKEALYGIIRGLEKIKTTETRIDDMIRIEELKGSLGAGAAGSAGATSVAA